MLTSYLNQGNQGSERFRNSIKLYSYSSGHKRGSWAWGGSKSWHDGVVCMGLVRVGAAGCGLTGLLGSQNTSILTRVWLEVIDNYYCLMRMGTL